MQVTKEDWWSSPRASPRWAVGNNPWLVTLQLNERELEFQIDTGAEANVIPEWVHTRNGSPSLSPVMQTFRGPSKKVIPIKGQFMGRLRKENIEVEQEIYMAKALHKPLLGQPAIEALGLVQRIQGIQLKKFDPVEQFPSLFWGLGSCKVNIRSIKLQEGAKPYAPTTPEESPYLLWNQSKRNSSVWRG